MNVKTKELVQTHKVRTNWWANRHGTEGSEI